MPRQCTALTTLAATALLALPLAACTPEFDTPTAEDVAPTDDGTTSPEDRVAGYFAAFDDAAEEGWQDTSYNASS